MTGLHVESSRPTGRPRPTALLFVHGAWHGAWCWQEHFLPYFAGHGYPSHAVDLRGHGRSPGADRLRHIGLADHVADLEPVVRRLGPRVVLVGHSMGGSVVQKYLETRPAAGGVLLASLPPASALPVALRMAVRHPLALLRANLTRSLWPLVASPALAREAFFSPDIPDERLLRYVERLQDESYRAFLDVVALDRRRPRRIRTPMLVVGADRDTFLTRGEVRATARAFGTTARFFPTAHDMMLEDGWSLVADHVRRWCDGLAQPDTTVPAIRS